MANPTAIGLQGPVSSNDNSNTVFVEPAFVGDIAWADITPPSGREYLTADITADGCHIALVEEGPYAPTLTLEPWSSQTRIWLKIVSEFTNPKLRLPPVSQSTEIPSDGNISGDNTSTSVVSGAANEVVNVEGGISSDSDVEADVTAVGGSKPASGNIGSTSVISGSAKEVGVASGKTEAASVVSGSATKPAAPRYYFDHGRSVTLGSTTKPGLMTEYSPTLSEFGVSWETEPPVEIRVGVFSSTGTLVSSLLTRGTFPTPPYLADTPFVFDTTITIPSNILVSTGQAMTINIGASNPMATPPVLSNKYIKAGTYNVHIEGMSYWMDDGEGGEALCHHVNNNSWVDQAILGDL